MSKTEVALAAAAVSGVLLIVALTSCANPQKPMRKALTNNPTFDLEVLFETVDGCTLRRFRDDGRYHYFATCRDGERTVTYYPSGKNIEIPEEIDTQYLPEFHEDPATNSEVDGREYVAER